MWENSAAPSGDAWERRWAPYDEPTYQAVLAHVRPTDRVLEIGAGDLRLACRLAVASRLTIAIEIQEAILQRAIHSRGGGKPQNLIAICGDARSLPFPAGITLGVLLMRHCTHFQLYAEKLVASGCRRLVTNARWGFGVEVVDLLAPRRPHAEIRIGWFACRCGATGFVPGPPRLLTPAVAHAVHEVEGCPRCDPERPRQRSARYEI